jgi:FKBP-type peptidyl-prolyl cis-trans isomerase
MRAIIAAISATVALMACPSAAFSLSMEHGNTASRRAFLGTAASSAAAVITAASVQTTQNANAAPEIFNTNGGIKYATLKQPTKGSYPQTGDIVAIEYTGYLTSGVIFDATHGEGKKNALLFNLGSTAVIPGFNEMVAEMVPGTFSSGSLLCNLLITTLTLLVAFVGQKVQAIIPPALAFGEKGICLETGECLVKPGSTLVYDIFLKKSSIPPP